MYTYKVTYGGIKETFVQAEGFIEAQMGIVFYIGSDPDCKWVAYFPKVESIQEYTPPEQ